MGVAFRVTGTVASQTWDQKAMQQLAVAVVAAVGHRTFDRGIGESDEPLKPYSTTPITIAFESDTGKRLRPRGGTPVYGFGDGAKGVTFEPGQTVATDPEGRKRYKFGRSFLFRDTSDDGDTGSTRGPMTGRHYENGYAEYKKMSRRGLTNKNGATGAEVNLTLSGQLSRSLRVIRVSRTAATVGLTGSAREYGKYVDAARPFLKLSPQDGKDLEPHFADIMAAAMERGARGPR